MTEQEIQSFEKELKAVSLRPLSGAFFVAVEKELATETGAETVLPEEGDLPEELAEVELALRRLTPRSPSAEFFRKVEVALEANTEPREKTFPSPKRSGFLLAFPRRLSAVAAAAVAAFAGLWYGAETWFGDYSAVPKYELVSMENELRNIEELPIEMQDDGSLVRPVRYIYTNTKRWRDPDSEKTFVECVPFEKIVSTAVAVY